MKYLITLLLLAALIFFLFPRLGRLFLGWMGISLGDMGRAGKELATGQEIRNSPLARYEVRAGEVVALKLLTQYPASGKRDLQEQVSAVGGRIASQADRKEIPYRFAVVESDSPNAFAVPGGSIFITRPLLELCAGNESHLAGVLAHELIHVDRRHALRNLAATTAVRTGFKFLAIGRAILLSRLSRGIEELVLQGYRQDQELEADTCGTRVLGLAGYDPRGLLAVIEKLNELRPEQQGAVADLLGYLKTHPPLAVRRENLQREVARLLAKPGAARG